MRSSHKVPLENNRIQWAKSDVMDSESEQALEASLKPVIFL